MNDEKQCCNNTDQPDANLDGNQSQKGSCCSAGASCGGMTTQDWQGILAQVKAVLSDPVNCWTKIKEEQKSVKEIYLSYLIPLAVVGAVAQIIGNMFFGGAFGFIHGIAFTVVTSVISLALLFVGGYLFSTLATYFGGTVKQEDAFRLVAYSATASLVAGVLAIYPPLAVLGILFFLYNLYTLYSGIPAMTGIVEKRIPYFAAGLVSYLVAGFLINLVLIGILGLKLVTT